MISFSFGDQSTQVVFNHYHGRHGLEMPYTQQAIAKISPKGAGFQTDHVGFGTLLFLN